MAKGVLREVNEDAEAIPCKKRQPKAVEKVIVAEKENTPIVRRSKRKITTAVKEKNTDLVVNLKPKKQSAKSAKSTKTKSKKSTLKSSTTTSISAKSNHDVDLSQNKLTLPALTLIAEDQEVSKSSNPVENESVMPSGIGEDSGFESSSRVSDQSSCQSVICHSPVAKCFTASNEEACMLTSETPPLSYWKLLAEERRIALGEALCENESLHIQLEVLEADNAALKEIVKQAEEMASMVKGMIE